MDKQLTEIEFLKWLYNDVVAEGGGSVSKELWHRIQYLEANAQEVCEWKQVNKSGCDINYHAQCGWNIIVKEYDYDDNYCRICGRKIELKAGEGNDL